MVHANNYLHHEVMDDYREMLELASKNIGIDIANKTLTSSYLDKIIVNTEIDRNNLMGKIVAGNIYRSNDLCKILKLESYINNIDNEESKSLYWFENSDVKPLSGKNNLEGSSANKIMGKLFSAYNNGLVEIVKEYNSNDTEDTQNTREEVQMSPLLKLTTKFSEEQIAQIRKKIDNKEYIQFFNKNK